MKAHQLTSPQMQEPSPGKAFTIIYRLLSVLVALLVTGPALLAEDGDHESGPRTFRGPYCWLLDCSHSYNEFHSHSRPSTTLRLRQISPRFGKMLSPPVRTLHKEPVMASGKRWGLGCISQKIIQVNSNETINTVLGGPISLNGIG
jgi:hypothetical protein